MSIVKEITVKVLNEKVEALTEAYLKSIDVIRDDMLGHKKSIEGFFELHKKEAKSLEKFVEILRKVKSILTASEQRITLLEHRVEILNEEVQLLQKVAKL